MITSPAESLKLLAPEIIVAITGALILIFDLLIPRNGSDGEGTASDTSQPSARGQLALLGVGGLAVAAVAVLALRDQSTALFEGIIVLDPLAAYLKLVFLAIGAIVLLLSIEALPRFTRWPAEFYALIVWCTLGHMLLASAAELFTIFLALQLTSLPLIVLIAFAKRDPRSSEAAMKYLLLVLVSTAVLLYGMTLVYGSLGTSTITEIGSILAEKTAAGEPFSAVLSLGLVLLLTGFAFKITAFPFHWWVPDVYTGAPTPVTAFLSVGSKFAGFALALRIIITGLPVPLDWHIFFGVMAALSMTFGNLSAIRQTNIKRMLAYSGIAQAGYLLVGLAALSQQGVGALLFYLIAYGFANLLAFGVVIAFAETTGNFEISDYAGLWRRSPYSAFVLTVALLSLAGLPLMGGFMAKFYVFLFAAEAGLVWLVAIGVINSVIAIYYYLRVVWQIYVGENGEGRVSTGPAGAVAMALCTAGVFVLGLFPEPFLRAAQHAASALFGG